MPWIDEGGGALHDMCKLWEVGDIHLISLGACPGTKRKKDKSNLFTFFPCIFKKILQNNKKRELIGKNVGF